MLRQHAAQLIAVTEDFERIQSKLTDLYKQDKKGAYKFYRAGGQVECRRLGMEVSTFNVWKYQGGQIRTKSNKYKGKAKSPLILISSFSQRV